MLTLTWICDFSNCRNSNAINAVKLFYIRDEVVSLESVTNDQNGYAADFDAMLLVLNHKPYVLFILFSFGFEHLTDGL